MLKEIDMAGAIARIRDGFENICVVTPVTKETTINELMNARGFVMVSNDKIQAPEQKPEPKPKQDKQKKTIDHGKIIALHKAGWSASKIAPEVGCALQTVINHINAEKDKTE